MTPTTNGRRRIDGTSRTTAYTFSPDFVDLGCTVTSVSSGFCTTLDLPFGGVGEASVASETSDLGLEMDRVELEEGITRWVLVAQELVDPPGVVLHKDMDISIVLSAHW
jgi:hypothetical protein